MPTANIEMNEKNKRLVNNLIPGVYAGFGLFPDTDKDYLCEKKIFHCAISIGWNPVYENDEKTIEVFIIHDFEYHDFYDEILSI